MNENFVKSMFELANKLEKFEYVLRLKCEICGPILRGADYRKYPKCKRHDYSEKE